MERMSTRRRGERVPKPGEEEAKAKAEEKAALAAEEKARAAEAKAAAEAAAAAGPSSAAAAVASSSAAAPASASGSSGSAKQKEPPSAAAPPPRPKRPKIENTEGLDMSWGEPAPPPIGIHPQPLLPMTTIAGTGDPGFADGVLTRVAFRGPMGITIGADGCLFVCDADNRRLRKIVRKQAPPMTLGAAAEAAAGGTGAQKDAPAAFESVCTVAGCGQAGMREGRAREATLYDPSGVVVDAEGNVLIADAGTHTIRRLSPNGEVRLIAGCGKPGYQDGTGGV